MKNLNLKTMTTIAGNKDKTWYLLQSEVAVVLGITRQSAAEFLIKNSIPHYLIGKSKKYLLNDIVETVEKSRWKA